MRKLSCSALLLAMVVANSSARLAKSSSPNVTARDRAAAAENGPAELYVIVDQIQQELELIRQEMGKPRDERRPLQVQGALPREVLFQATTLFLKSDRLAFEHTREKVAVPQPPAGEVTTADVAAVLTAVLARVQRVKEELDIVVPSEPQERDTSRQHTDVFVAIVQANRQINLLLDRQWAPSDVFQQVTRAIAYAARLLETFGEATPLPQPEEFVRRKRPADVYKRLLRSFERISELETLSGRQTLELIVTPEEIEQAQPSDVFDIASLLVAELSHMHAQRADVKPARSAYDPGRKLPSHVYQRVSILDAQLELLLRHIQEHPDWLGRRDGE